jgi:hypothetical protein
MTVMNGIPVTQHPGQQDFDTVQGALRVVFSEVVITGFLTHGYDGCLER